MNNKESAQDFLQLVVAGKVDEAYEKYVDFGGKHHNIHTPASFADLQKAMKESEVNFPNKQFTIKHILEDGDLVAVHSHLVLKTAELELTTIHMMRFADDKIVEMWDIGQQIPEDCPNQDGAF
ncbi:MAG: nuclear transport factor 2 family protein [Patescibacteria group bacterium]